MSSEIWERLPETDVQKVSYRTVVTKRFKLPNGEVLDFGTTGNEGSNDVAVIALTPEKKVVVSRLFRPGPEVVMEELPGGYVDDGESIQDAGIRELGEESGFVLSDDSEVKELGSIPQQDAYANNRKNYFLITNVVLGKEQKLEAEETITADTIAISRLISNAKEGRMTDAVAVLMAYDELRAMDEEG